MVGRRNRFGRRVNRFRRFRRVRRRRTPVLFCKLTRTVVVTHNNSVEQTEAFHVTLNDFAEHINLAPNFERVKVLRQVIKVYPQQNVANNTTSRIGSYALVPYHKPMPTTTPTYGASLSIDRAKIFRGTSFGRMSFVPATRLGADASPNNQFIRTDWKPEFEIGTTATLPVLYTGFIAFEANTGNLNSSIYTIVQDLYVRYRNQRSFI